MSAPLLASREALAMALHDHLGCAAPDFCERPVPCVTLTRTRQYANALLASGVVRDPATLADDDAVIETARHAWAAAGMLPGWSPLLRALATALTEVNR